MKKRTQGLSQFEIRRENVLQYMYEGASEERLKKGIEAMLPQLHTTVVVTGWLRNNDKADFQLAWGVQPTCEYEDPYDNERRIRQMKRFYAIHNPPLVHLCEHFMHTLQKRLKKNFSWDRIWNSLEHKYGSNPDHLLPLDTTHDNEVFLSTEEQEMIGGVLHDAKTANLHKRGYGLGEVDLGEGDEISELLANVTPKKSPRRSTHARVESGTMENEMITAQSDLALDTGNSSDDEMKERGVQEIEMSDFSSQVASDGDDDNEDLPAAVQELSIPHSPSLQERMAQQRQQQVSFLKENGVIEDESSLKEGAGSPRMSGADSEQRSPAQDPRPAIKNEDAQQEGEEERAPIVWDWKRLYGTADIHTVTWETKFLSSLCHIVENMALEVSSQATKMALQYSVIGAIISAVAM